MPLAQDDGVLLLSGGFLWNWRNVEAWEPLAEDRSEVVEDLESSLAVDLSLGVASLNRICMVISDCLLDEDRLADVQLHESVVGWDVDRGVSRSRCALVLHLVLVVALVLLLVILLLIVTIVLRLLLVIWVRVRLRILIVAVLLLLVIWVLIVLLLLVVALIATVVLLVWRAMWELAVKVGLTVLLVVLLYHLSSICCSYSDVLLI